MLQRQTQDAPAIGAILFGLSVAAVFAGAGFNQLPSRWHNLVTFLTSLSCVACIVALYYIHLKSKSTHHQNNLFQTNK